MNFGLVSAQDLALVSREKSNVSTLETFNLKSGFVIVDTIDNKRQQDKLQFISIHNLNSKHNMLIRWDRWQMGCQVFILPTWQQPLAAWWCTGSPRDGLHSRLRSLKVSKTVRLIVDVLWTPSSANTVKILLTGECQKAWPVEES